MMFKLALLTHLLLLFTDVTSCHNSSDREQIIEQGLKEADIFCTPGRIFTFDYYHTILKRCWDSFNLGQSCEFPVLTSRDNLYSGSLYTKDRDPKYFKSFASVMKDRTLTSPSEEFSTDGFSVSFTQMDPTMCYHYFFMPEMLQNVKREHNQGFYFWLQWLFSFMTGRALVVGTSVHDADTLHFRQPPLVEQSNGVQGK